MAKKLKVKTLVPWNYLCLSDLYNAIGDTKEHQKSLYNLIESASLDNDTSFLELGYFTLGSSYTQKERSFEKADSLLNRCLNIALIRKDTSFIVRSLANLGWNNYLERRYEAAIKFYNKALTYSLPAKIYANAANCYGNLGTIYRDMEENEKSLNNYLKAIEQAKLGGNIRELEWVYQDMSEMYLRNRDTSNAYKSYVMFKKYSDQLIKESSKQGLTDARIRYEADTRNKELELLSLRLRNHKLINYSAAGLLLLSLAIFILILSRARINARRKISEMNHMIAEVRQANLRQQMNPHFIFNTLNSIQYYMYQHDKLATNNYLTKFSSLMRKVLENSQHTSVPLRDELDALKLYLDLEIIRFKDKFIYEITVDEELDTLLYKVPTMLIQPYVENSICHGLIPAENKGYIKIDLKLKDEYISCIIEDNGIGRDAAMEKKKKGENNHNSLGTQIVSSRLDLVNALYGTTLKTIYTDLKNDAGESEGTRVEIQIPILS
jgi:anti-sigma regulatory factor (Ser/Thr protein kinase)